MLRGILYPNGRLDSFTARYARDAESAEKTANENLQSLRDAGYTSDAIVQPRLSEGLRLRLGSTGARAKEVSTGSSSRAEGGAEG